MRVDFAFFDRRFRKHGYQWNGAECGGVPRAGDEIVLPGLEGGGPLRHKSAKWRAISSVVESVTWWLADAKNGPVDDSVTVYCRILWVKCG